MTEVPFVSMTGIERRFSGRSGPVSALTGVSIDVPAGQTLGIVGESGSGKSTLGRILVGLDRADAGEIRIEGQPQDSTRRMARPGLQMVFQDPFSSLNPRMTVGRQVAEALVVEGRLDRGEIERRVVELFQEVGLSRDQVGLYPHEFSGGQRQRIAIARSLAPRPRLVVADEPVSALDVSVQAQILNLLAEIQRRDGLAFLFIAHDIAVVAHISHVIAVMYRGTIVEQGLSQEIVENPQHPYTRRLIDAVPRLGRRRGKRTADQDAGEFNIGSRKTQISASHFYLS